MGLLLLGLFSYIVAMQFMVRDNFTNNLKEPHSDYRLKHPSLGIKHLYFLSILDQQDGLDRIGFKNPRVNKNGRLRNRRPFWYFPFAQTVVAATII